MKLSLKSLNNKSKNMEVFSYVSNFRFFCFQIFFSLHIRFIFASKTFFASLRNEAKQTLFFAISLPFFRFCFASFRFKRKFGDTL
jgi:hypothetical protein